MHSDNLLWYRLYRIVDNMWEQDELAHAFESRVPTLFHFQTRKYFKI